VNEIEGNSIFQTRNQPYIEAVIKNVELDRYHEDIGSAYINRIKVYRRNTYILFIYALFINELNYCL